MIYTMGSNQFGAYFGSGSANSNASGCKAMIIVRPCGHIHDRRVEFPPTKCECVKQKCDIN